jgi:pSer/pThr/pTyr-binding forkhead associated (FHA) protein
MLPHNHAGQLIPREPRRAPVDVVAPQLIEQFATDCGLRGTLRLVVCNEATGVTEKFNVDEPFAIVGRASNCQVRLNHPDVNYRHAYLQVIEGRVYCYDLDSEHGVRWGSRRRKKGVFTARDVLHIGPFSVRLSQAAAYGPAVNSADTEWDLQNETIEGLALRFMNASGRTSHSPLRPLRAAITLLGRSGRSHCKLSDTSVSQVHCSIVRTADSLWVVDLLGRDGTSVNGRTVRFARFEDGDELTLGRFRMQLCEVARDQDSVLADDAILTTTASREPAPFDDESDGDERCDVIPLPPEPPVPTLHNQANFHAPVVGKVHGISENILLAMMEQFGQMQQQLLAHTQQQMTMLAQMFSGLYQGQQASIVEQLNRIHEISSELNQLRAGSMAWPRVDGGGAESPIPAPPVAARDPQVADERPDAGAASPSMPRSAAPFADQATQAAPPADATEAFGRPESADPDVTETDTESDVRLPFEDSTDSAPGARDGGTSRQSKTVDHEWVTQRINDLERERNGRWRRLLQLIGGGKDLN